MCKKSLLIFFLFPLFSSFSQTYNYTGVVQYDTITFDGCMSIKAWGAGGAKGGDDSGNNGGAGGGGSYAEEMISVNIGDVLSIYVGGGASGGTGCVTNGGAGIGGWGYGNGGNGGNSGSSGCSGGGGAGGGGSAVLLNGTAVLVAGGGGGGGGGGCSNGGGAAGGGGQNGQSASPPGSAGTAGAGGGINGAQGINRGGGDGAGGGGGGGGWNGGSGGGVTSQGGSDCGYGGGAGGGGGGNSLGTVIINATGQTPGNNTDPDLCAGCATGAAPGGNGLVIANFIPLTIAVSNDTIICGGGSATLTASGGTSYLWSPSAGLSSTVVANPTATPVSSTTYSVTVSDAAGCSDTASINVVVSTPFGFSQVGTTVTDADCNSSCTGSITVSLSGTTAPYTYFWNPTPSNGQNNPNAQNLCAGIYSLTVADVTGCTKDTAFTVNEPSAMVLVSTSNPVTCNQGNDGIADISVSGSTLPYSYNWSSGGTTPTVSGLNAGTYYVTATDGNSCSEIAAVIVTQPTVVTLAATASPALICQGQTSNLTGNAINGNGSPYTYVWDGIDTTQINSVSPTDTTTYFVVAYDINGCLSDTQDVTVDVYDLLTITVSTDDTICEGGTTTINASATDGSGEPYTYTWDNGAGTGSNVSVSPTSYPNPTIYTVTVSDNCSPDTTAQVSVSFYPTPQPGFFASPTTFGCEPLTVLFTDTTQYDSCYWDFGDGNTASECDTSNIYLNDGTYDITFTLVSPEGCVGDSVFEDYVVVNPTPTADFLPDPQTNTILFTDIDFTDFSFGDIISWDWDFATEDLSAMQHPNYEYPPVPATYPVELIVTTAYGCKDTVVKEVVINQGYAHYVPTSFSPNGDGLNDEFFVKGVGIDVDKFELFVFNRWGDIVFAAHHPDERWDGTSPETGGTKLIPEGVYIWKLAISDELGTKAENRKFYGTITLIR
ncbi:MAG: hypothetical protein COA57_07440 [Flavobacteriales bacterium]|nr:MAG: hypothetical protein COA57_07440 [Flavobacteriales bacterium]